MEWLSKKYFYLPTATAVTLVNVPAVTCRACLLEYSTSLLAVPWTTPATPLPPTHRFINAIRTPYSVYPLAFILRSVEGSFVQPEELPVWMLVKLERADLIAQAITAGLANLNGKDPGTGDGPLHWAVTLGLDDILRWLIEKGKMDVNSYGQ